MLDDWNLCLSLALNAATDSNPTVVAFAKAAAAWGMVPVLATVAAL